MREEIIDENSYQWLTPEGSVYILVIKTTFEETSFALDQLREDGLATEDNLAYIRKIALELQEDPRFGPEHRHVIFLLTSPALSMAALRKKVVEFHNYAAAKMPEVVVSAMSIPFQNITAIPIHFFRPFRFLPQPSLN